MRWRWIAIILLLPLIIFTGCGDGDNEPQPVVPEQSGSADDDLGDEDSTAISENSKTTAPTGRCFCSTFQTIP